MATATKRFDMSSVKGTGADRVELFGHPQRLADIAKVPVGSKNSFRRVWVNGDPCGLWQIQGKGSADKAVRADLGVVGERAPYKDNNGDPITVSVLSMPKGKDAYNINQSVASTKADEEKADADKVKADKADKVKADEATKSQK